MNTLEAVHENNKGLSLSTNILKTEQQACALD